VFPSVPGSRSSRLPGDFIQSTRAVTTGLVRAILEVMRRAPLRVPVRGIDPASCTLGRGRYRLLMLLGAGGAGSVYRARDHLLDRIVAVKLLRPGHDEVARARLKSEAQIAASLSNPAMAHILDYGEERIGGEISPYLVMEYVEGVNLREVLRGGPLPPDRVVDLVAQVAEALSAAHSAGVVHRDVKPANIMLDARGRAVLLDFGAARQAEADPLTLTGTIVGTVDYISPEQAAGEGATPRSDLYALGMVAHEALTGARALSRQTQVATLLAHVTDDVEPLPVDIPSGLRTLVEQLVQRDPLRRPADAATVAQRARRWSRSTAKVAKPSPRSTSPQALAATDRTISSSAVGGWLCGLPAGGARRRARPAAMR
jgi:serine/threonine protein kinase